MEKLTKLIIDLCIKLLTLVLLCILVYSVLEFCLLFIQSLINHPLNFYIGEIRKENTFLGVVLNLIAGILLILIIVEIIELVKDYHQVSKKDYLALVIEIAIISIVRHLIVMDFEHLESNAIFGLGIVLFVICGFYIFLRLKKRTKNLLT